MTETIFEKNALYIFSLVLVPSTNRMYDLNCSQPPGGNQGIWLHFWGAVISSIFVQRPERSDISHLTLTITDATKENHPGITNVITKSVFIQAS